MERGKIFSFAETKYEWNMKEISVSELQDNMFDAIGKEWMLVTAGTQEKFNMMTASWGGTGILWGKPVAFIFIRPERYTYEFIEEGDKLTLSFLGEEHKDVHKICGSKSGRDMDKVAASGLKPYVMEDGTISYEQARLVLVCKKLYADMIQEDKFVDKLLINRWYGEGHGNLHKMYILEIQHIYVK